MLGIVEGAFMARSAAAPTTPVVVSVPHAGVRTAGYEETLTPELDVRGDADLFVDRLYRVGEPDGPETYVSAQLSRFVCDLNRDPDDVAPGAVPEHRAPRNVDGRGFIWAVTTTGAPALSRPLTLPEWSGRTAIHTAYHEAISRALLRARARFGFAVLVDGHSMPSRGRAGHTDTGSVRADVVPGDRDGTSCSPALRALVTRHFAAAGLSVKPNEPYKGGFITTHHGRPADNVHAIQIELRRDLYMDEENFVIVQPGFDRLRGLIAGLLLELRGFNP
ncbi:MAG TPA: N-formylglutamate amidohydrolase [Polyangia bacterium]|nr:N-formylglutamate amidohydrolase [Polyangia bacterium]